MAGMRTSLYFTAPERVEIREEPLPVPGPGEVRVATQLTGISPGTEMLIYRGLMPQGMETDATLPALAGKLTYPLKYGYASVGVVEAVGEGVSSTWLGRTVFAFQPHHSHYVTPVRDVHLVPEGIGPEDAIFLPNMETAVNFLMDGRPMIGERVVVLGQGVVGLLTTALLALLPLENLIVVDRYERRLRMARDLGAHIALSADTPDLVQRLQDVLGSPQDTGGADLVYEVSGVPEVLNLAISITGFAGRIVVGSWYGSKRAPLDLGGRFHRARLRIISSQVSTIAPEHMGRWDKQRRLEVAWHWVQRLRPSRLITHRFPLSQAPAAYALIAHHPEETIQVVLEYEE